MTKARIKLARLIESCGPGNCDCTSPGVLRDCKILGFDSTRGRRYTEEAVENAAPLYEGAPVFLDHPEEDAAGRISKSPRSVRDKFGLFENVRYVPGDGLRGDFRYNTAHPFASTFEGWVAMGGDQIGFSHNALTDTSRNKQDPDGTAVITNVAEVLSVDLVSRGATTQGLREAHMDPDIDAPAVTPEPAPAPVDAGAGGYEEHLANMVKAIMTDGSLDKAAKKKKLMKALDLCEDEKAAAPVVEEDEPVEEADEPDFLAGKDKDDKEKDKEVTEAARLAASDPRLKPLVESHDRLRTEKRVRLLESRCRDMCVEAKLPLVSISEVFLAQLVEARNDKARHALIEDRKTLGVSRKPQSQSPRGGANGSKKLTSDDIMLGVTS